MTKKDNEDFKNSTKMMKNIEALHIEIIISIVKD